MARSKSSNRLLEPRAAQAMEQLKLEVAQQFGIALSSDGYYGNMLTRDAGTIGGNMTKRLVQMAEQTLNGYTSR
ncbi:alpha/beta-type small acid-soluble spore protein [Paenibacillus sp. N1-5-1-14]|uniref:alpha/beta-type small acid-soluble spore protein n=1 Tax=Paenibacillus radicibacter TaxID=2972488 RepID=UPI0021596463|nr:alpha/beta-type small acid-soluble spore protein [Paenibacillus radicibacter]MCR8641581.1 alpha/beta-type small acid-soluble spore protein [Paenibacillus radicibacter]